MGIDVINYQEIPIYRAISLLIGVLIYAKIYKENLYRENLYKEKEPITCLRERVKRRRASRYLSW